MALPRQPPPNSLIPTIPTTSDTLPLIPIHRKYRAQAQSHLHHLPAYQIIDPTFLSNMCTPKPPSALALPPGLVGDIANLIQPLKDDRDAWKATAEAYKSAFEEQTTRLREAISLCISTRIELEEARARCPPARRRATFEGNPTPGTAHIHAPQLSQASAGTRSSHTLLGEVQLPVEQPEWDWQSNHTTKAHFGHVEQLANRDDFTKAREEIDRILPGRLSNEARVEGLLLKSAICRASGPDWVLEALAQCSEALALCENLRELEFLRPKILFQRGLCLLRLRELEQAREAFRGVGDGDGGGDRMVERARALGRTCEELLGLEEGEGEGARRRSAFEEQRAVAEGFLSSLKEKEKEGENRVCVYAVACDGLFTNGLQASWRRSSGRIFSHSRPGRRTVSHRWRSAPGA